MRLRLYRVILKKPRHRLLSSRCTTLHLKLSQPLPGKGTTQRTHETTRALKREASPGSAQRRGLHSRRPHPPRLDRRQPPLRLGIARGADQVTRQVAQ